MALPPIQMTTHFQTSHPNYDTFVIDGSIFDIFRQSISSNESITFDLSGHSIIVMAPMEAQNNITIKGNHVIQLADIKAKTGSLDIKGTGKFITFGNETTSQLDCTIEFTQGQYTLTSQCRTYISEMLIRGLTEQDGKEVRDALIEVYDAAIDPLSESEESIIKIADFLEFFNIPAPRS